MKQEPSFSLCVKVQEDYKDVQDIIRISKCELKFPDVDGDTWQWWCSSRERELTKLISKYGRDTIKAFCTQWQEYGKQRMMEEIRKFPPGTALYETRHDPIPGIIPDGVNVRATVTVDTDMALIICDFTDNDNSRPCGLNLCEATLISAARTGILNRMSISMSEFPCCEGALGRIIVKMREGSIVGKAKHPFSSSLATTNVNDRAVVAVECALNSLTDRMAMAEPHYIFGVSTSVISGTDSRYGNRPYITQLISGHSGGPGE